jgi:mRNA-degrading endonuclease toxin of MazEF toxin-antitoxin module
MAPWDVCEFEFPHGKHPCVVISSEEVIAHRNEVVILGCRTPRESRPPKKYEIVLDEADGLDWATLCRCDFLFTVAKERVGAKRGSVCAARRKEIVLRVLKCLAFAGV